ncbi:hypothetical protein Hanom_Chr09g00764591 [Helianthus anomalus]
MGEWYSISVSQFGVDVGIYTKEEIVEPIFTDSLREMPDKTRNMFWAQIGDGPCKPSNTMCTKIMYPLIRYMRQVLSGTICHSRDNGVVENLRGANFPILNPEPTTPQRHLHALEEHGLRSHQHTSDAHLRWRFDCSGLQGLWKENPTKLHHQGWHYLGRYQPMLKFGTHRRL